MSRLSQGAGVIGTNAVKAKLREGGVALGSFCLEFQTRGIGRLSTAAGADFLVYDMEHTGWSTETIAWLLAARGPDLTPIVRVPSIETNAIGPVLDVGALGLMVPMVASAEHARAIVAAVRYPPAGRRGSAFGIAHDGYAPPADVAASMRAADEEILVIAQIETLAGMDALEEIAAVDGIDVLWLGQADFTASMGRPAAYDDSEFSDALARVAQVATTNDKAAGYLALSVEDARRVMSLGYRLVAYSGDLWLYQAALREGLDRIRSGSDPAELSE